MKTPNQSIALRIMEAFPPAERPPDSELTAHGDACYNCNTLIEAFRSERGETFSADRARWLVGELSLLSPSGLRWVMPSYLAAVFSKKTDSDLGEFFAYYFCSACSQEEQAVREAWIGSLLADQIDCLIEVLCAIRTRLGQVYFDSVDDAVAFLRERRM